MNVFSSSSSWAKRSPVWLLICVNSTQLWRKFISLKDQSVLLVGFIGLFLAGYASLAFALFYKGLEFIGRFPGLGTLLAERLLFLLFAFLFGLLLLSNLIISYTNLFRNRETQFLICLPLSAQTVFRWKFVESMLLASWAFIFLIAPLLAAFGMTRQVPWHFYPVCTFLLAIFIVLPGVLGAWLSLTLARFLERRVFQVVVLITCALFLVLIGLWFKPAPDPDEMQETRVIAALDKMLVKTRFAQYPFLPSYWLSSGVLNWAEGIFSSAIFFILVTLSYTLFFGSLALTQLGRFFVDSASAVWSRESFLGAWDWFRRLQERRRVPKYEKSLVEAGLTKLRIFPPEVVALVLKDARIFWRDTTQWGQTVVLFGLLGVYILNLRHFAQQLSNDFWVHAVSYLNLGACSLNLATVTTRFVFPQFSLEGKRLWIIGMAPFSLVKAVKTKYWGASLASLSVTLTLIVLSCQMLNMSADKILYFAGAVTVMTFTLNALAIGLGVLYPNFKEENPSKIVSGAGGTFCLILSFVYILGAVGLLALGSPWRSFRSSEMLVNVCWVGFLVLSALVGLVPFRLGLRRLEKLEI